MSYEIMGFSTYKLTESQKGVNRAFFYLDDTQLPSNNGKDKHNNESINKGEGRIFTKRDITTMAEKWKLSWGHNSYPKNTEAGLT